MHRHATFGQRRRGAQPGDATAHHGHGGPSRTRYAACGRPRCGGMQHPAGVAHDGRPAEEGVHDAVLPARHGVAAHIDRNRCGAAAPGTGSRRRTSLTLRRRYR